MHAVFTEIYGRRGSLIYNTKGEPLSIHVFMNNLLNFEGVLRQAKCIQTGLKEYTLQLNPAKGVHVDEEAVIASYRKYLGEDAVFTVEYVDSLPILESGKTMVSEQRCGQYQ
jgi:phenylacetate-CoA ligase